MYLQNFEIKNKIALVTGAGKGIGKASAIALAEAGADLIILSRTKSDLDKVKKQILKLKRNCQTFVCDVSDYNEVKSVFKEIKKIDVLINNAGVGITGPGEETNIKAMRDNFETNFFGPIKLMQQVLPSMRSNKNGLIIKEISLDTEGLISGEVYPSKGISPYMYFGDYPVLMLIFSIMLFYWKCYKKYE